MQTIKPKNISAGASNGLQMSKRLWHSKTGIVPILTTGAIIIAVGVVGFLAYKGAVSQGYLGGGDGQQKLQAAQIVKSGSTPSSDNLIPDPIIGSNCGLNGYSSFDFKAINPLDDDGSASYVATDVMVKTGETFEVYPTLSSNGFNTSATLQINCPGSYNAYVPAVRNTTASAMKAISANRPTGNTQLEIEQLDHVTVYAYDNLNKGFVYDDSDTDNTDGEELTSTKTFKSTTNNATAYAMGTGTKFDWTFSVYVGASQRSWGDLKNYIVIDADKSDFAQPSITWDGGSLKCIEMAKSALKSDDKGYLASYEYVCDLSTDIEEVLHEVRMKANPKSGQNPDVDMKVRFVAESLYVDGTDILQGIFDAGGNEVLMTPAQEINIDIS